MSKKKKTNVIVNGVTVDGPTPGEIFPLSMKTTTISISLPHDPIFSVAVYQYTKELTPFNELIAKFSHCVRRSETDKLFSKLRSK